MVNQIKVFFTTILLVALAAGISSCKVTNGQHNKRDNHLAETEIDSTHWLRPSSGIRSILEDRQGNLWFSSTEFVCRFDGEKVTYFSAADGLDGVGRIQEDQNGIIWVATGFQAYRFDGERFTSYPLIPDTTGSHWDIRPTDLWFQKGIEQFQKAPGPPGIFRYRDGDISFLAFPLPATENDASRYYPTSGAIKGKDGTTWFGTMEVVIGYRDGVFTLLDREKMGRSGDPNPIGIRGLYADTKGKLWMADNGSGYFVYDGARVTNFTQSHHLGKGEREANTLHRAFCAAEDLDGNMWFGTVYSGIWRYNPGTEEFTNFTEAEGVFSESFWTIYPTKDGTLLFAGEKPGAVYTFNGATFDRVF